MTKSRVAICCVFLISFAGTIDLANLFNYENQPVPDYVTKDNQPVDNQITDAGATLGRVLFYDKRLSLNNSISCGSCHLQEFGFSDTARVSVGYEGGVTGRHSMRLINHRFAEGSRSFWDQRAEDLEDQSTQPIQDHIEMGFSGTNGQPKLDSLLEKLSRIDDYQLLFEFVFGDPLITEERIQTSLAQFVRSIQSFDSRFDEGLAQVNNLPADFPNYTDAENRGKRLFINPPGPAGQGAGCQGCHRAPEFDIDPNSMNNGVIAVAGDPSQVDLDNTRAPSLRDLVNPSGQLNGPLMHNGNFTSLRQVIDHYNAIPFDPQVNLNLDRRLQGPPGMGGGQRLNLSEQQKQDLEAFLLTLTGTEVYEAERLSDPFAPNGELEIKPIISNLIPTKKIQTVLVFPNPTTDYVTWTSDWRGVIYFEIFNPAGKRVDHGVLDETQLELRGLKSGVYIGKVYYAEGYLTFRVIKE